MRPLVSLITPVYNAMPYFKEYLDSVLEQTWRPLEFICINDGSDDNSFEYLEQMRPEFEKKGIAVQHKKVVHGGQARAVNEALKLVNGEFITWCDADDIMLPENIEKKALFLVNNSDLDMVRNDGIRVEDGKEEFLSSKSFDRKQQNIFDALFHDKTYCYAGCYMLRSKTFFQCYSKREIPVSEEGQNLQLLMPVASISECGFIAEKLHIYRKRCDGHSGKKRSFTQAFLRMKNFTNLKLQILQYCSCDREYYRQEAVKMEIENRQKLLILAAQAAREEIKDENRNSDIL